MTWRPPRMFRSLEDRITGFDVLGERNSGTNYVSQLLQHNVRGVAATSAYGWKHGFVDRREAARDGLLTVVVYRHPLRWLQSVAARPLEMSRSMRNLPFAEFIRHEWQGAFSRDDGTEEASTADMDPVERINFANPMAMRAAKLRYFEEMAEMPGRIVFVRFEDANRRPRATLEAVAQRFDLRLGPFVPIESFKGNKSGRYVPKRLPPVTAADRTFISQELDLRLEARIGYRLEDVPMFDGLPVWDSRSLRSLMRGLRARWDGSARRGKG